jgi:hypothetical protein
VYRQKSKPRERDARARDAAERIDASAHHRRIAAEHGEKVAARRQRKKEEASGKVGTWVSAHRSVRGGHVHSY